VGAEAAVVAERRRGWEGGCVVCVRTSVPSHLKLCISRTIVLSVEDQQNTFMVGLVDMGGNHEEKQGRIRQ
jgi:hypothetical protein